MFLKKIICKIFGHVPTELNVEFKTATCYRCNAILSVSYDMAYGETIVLEKIK